MARDVAHREPRRSASRQGERRAKRGGCGFDGARGDHERPTTAFPFRHRPARGVAENGRVVLAARLLARSAHPPKLRFCQHRARRRNREALVPRLRCRAIRRRYHACSSSQVFALAVVSPPSLLAPSPLRRASPRLAAPRRASPRLAVPHRASPRHRRSRVRAGRRNFCSSRRGSSRAR